MNTRQETNCQPSADELAKVIDDIVARLRERGMRRTSTVTDVLAALLDPHRPYTLGELGERPALADRDPATIYRTVNRLKDLGVVQQLSLGGRAGQFLLDLPDHHHDYLCCQSCGQVAEIHCELDEIESRLAKESGWSRLNRSLAFHGVCPECEPA